MPTPFELHALHELRDTGYGKASRPSAIGYMLWQKSDPETRKRNPSPQGLALFGGKFLRGLVSAGLAGWHDGYYITQKGRELLAAPTPTEESK